MTLYFFLAAFTLGLFMGSFLSVIIPRLHFEEKGIIMGRSHCRKCKKQLGPFELIPLFSFLVQRGKCKKCKTKLSHWYPTTEFVTALTFGALTLYSASIMEWLILAALFFVFLFIYFYDLRYKEIHDAIMLPGILFAIVASFLIGDPLSSFIGAIIGFVFFGLQYLVSKGKWLGSGDIRIGIFMGLALGWQNMAVALFISYIIGSVLGIFLLVTKRAKAGTALPLGPFLVLGSMIAFFFGETIINWYLWTLLY
ncbi:prepilin peptidase [Candidatus Peregrinibacteria bacterium]|jgi:leader peptidase (prepilin peptidase) / N-methyltransferase|nr:prepilin peptidase [Candidatus Peregrinibacteria bacterium]MBT4632143.1 prepilin peptidase [Candidatus Peregrinibacteria bacterium]MBT5517066.1 prepilin peptidase [Candidatus Peregrinibacteria bacterium]MBT5824061.1 prepilin peptidase [Candidatus Peregrinibacteria bacterium]